MKPSPQIQTSAIPFAWEGAELWIGLVTPFRGKSWTLPRISVSGDRCPADAACSEALRAGGFVGTIDESEIAVTKLAKGGQIRFFALEISALLETWEGEKHHRRKLVPLSRIEKYVTDRNVLRVIRQWLTERLEMELAL